MSRINRGRIEEGDSISAGDLNTRFADYSQTDLNDFNHREAAYDLPQFSTNRFLCPFIAETTIGKLDVYHAAPITLAGQTILPANPYSVGNGTAVTPLSFGLGGLTISAGQILRTYYNLSVNPTFQGRPWVDVGSISSYTFPDPAGTGTRDIATDVSAWVMYLQWDITSNALTNFVAVPKQGNYKTNLGSGIYGGPLSNSMSVVPIPAWVERADLARDGNATGSWYNRIGWRGVSGAWFYPRATGAGSVTIYGIKVVIKGIMHSYNIAGVNYLVHDPVASAGTTLEYTSGNLSVIVNSLE